MSFNIDGTSDAAIRGIDQIAKLILDADMVYLVEDHYSVYDKFDSILKDTYPFSTHIVCNDTHVL